MRTIVFFLTLSLLAALGLIACNGAETAAFSHGESATLTVTPAAEPAIAAAPIAPAAASMPRDFRVEAAQYIGWYNYYRLTPEQEKIKKDALSRMPAPCCADNTMATCCCPCNMAKAVWGLSAHLIVEKGYDSDRLEKEVRQWLTDIHPNGASGEACYKGGCLRSFENDGCGGMKEGYIL